MANPTFKHFYGWPSSSQYRVVCCCSVLLPVAALLLLRCCAPHVLVVLDMGVAMQSKIMH